MAAGERFLLDTHAVIWWWLKDPSLSNRARDVLTVSTHEIMVSAVSGYEIAQKVRMGKLPALAEALPRFADLVVDHGFTHLNIDHRYAIRAGVLPGEHRDPFDRLIAAQALTDDLTVVTRDPAFAGFGCKLLW